MLEGMGPDSVPLEPQVFEAAVRKLRGRLMPPPRRSLDMLWTVLPDELVAELDFVARPGCLPSIR